MIEGTRGARACVRPPARVTGAAWALLLIALPVALATMALPERACSAALFGSEPGGNTIGGPGRTALRDGATVELFGFLFLGPTPSRFVCLSGFNEGPGTVTVIFKARIGESMTARIDPGQTRVLCGTMTAIEVGCHGQGGNCGLQWRVDDPR